MNYEKSVFLLVLWLAIVGWSCQSSNFDEMKNESSLSLDVELNSIDDLPYQLIDKSCQKEPFIEAVTKICKDKLGKKLFEILEKQLGNEKIKFVFNKELTSWEMRKTDLATIEYGPFNSMINKKSLSDMFTSLICHELFHIYIYQCHVDFNLGTKKLNLEVEAYIFQYKFWGRTKMEIPDSLHGLWSYLRELDKFLGNEGQIPLDVDKREFNFAYESVIKELYALNDEYRSMLESKDDRDFNTIVQLAYLK